MATSKFTSTLDEALMQQLRAARGGASPPKVKPSREPFKYEDGYQPISTMFEFDSVLDLDVPVKKFKPEDWDESIRTHIPKIDTGYVFDQYCTVSLAAAWYMEDACLIHGPKGSGKTTLPQQMAARLGIPYTRINGREDMESSALFGGVKFSPEQGVVWVDGPIAEFAKHGGIVCIDEVSRLPAGIVNGLMAVLEHGTDVFLADKPGTVAEKTIKRHPMFRIVCTDNTELQGDTTGKYVGTNVQDEALIDRFDTSIKLGYLSVAHEMKIIIGKVPQIDNRIAQQMVQLAGMIRTSYDGGNIGFTMSPRGLVAWAKKAVFWDNPMQAFKLCFFDKLLPSDRAVVAEFYHSVFAENIR